MIMELFFAKERVCRYAFSSEEKKIMAEVIYRKKSAK
jgi:hypothetical protein